MLTRLLFVAAQLKVPRSSGAVDTDEFDFLTNRLFLLVTGIVLFVVAATIAVAAWNRRAGRKMRNARKRAHVVENHERRRRLLGEESISSTRFRK
jgi:heme/copper-type cytochrome/quinol oxidase subunit 2